MKKWKANYFAENGLVLAGSSERQRHLTEQLGSWSLMCNTKPGDKGKGPRREPHLGQATTLALSPGLGAGK